MNSETNETCSRLFSTVLETNNEGKLIRRFHVIIFRLWTGHLQAEIAFKQNRCFELSLTP